MQSGQTKIKYAEVKSTKKLNGDTVYFLKTRSIQQLSVSLFCTDKILHEQVSNPEYTQFGIPKKTGGYREIKAPGEALKKIQKRLALLFNPLYDVPDGVHGFVRSFDDECFNHLSNACEHVGKKWVWNIDIESFFSSITTSMVVNQLMEEPFYFDESKAKYLSLLIVYKRQLPMGSPCSPIVSNLVCLEMDDQLNEWMETQNELYPDANLIYTRYADDITFSADLEFKEEQKLEVYAILNQHGFEINKKKERIQSHKQAQWVTGIKTNEKPNVDRKYIRTIRALLHQTRKMGLVESTTKFLRLNKVANAIEVDRFLRVLQGRISYIGFVKGKDDSAYLKYLKEWSELNNNQKIF